MTNAKAPTEETALVTPLRNVCLKTTRFRAEFALKDSASVASSFWAATRDPPRITLTSFPNRLSPEELARTPFAPLIKTFAEFDSTLT